jgi:Rhs element Vgr protein
MAQPIFSLASDSYATELEITSISGSESISSFFELKITFKVKNDIAKSLDHSLLTQEDIVLTVDKITGRAPYTIKGMFNEVEELFEKSNTHKFFTGVLVPTLWRQRKNQSYDIYTTKTAEDVISDELSNDLMLDHHLSLSQVYPPKEFICQYSESNFNFVSRIAEHWGIYYYFDHDQEGRLVFADDTNYEPLTVGVVELDQSNNPTNSFNTIRTLRRKYNSVPDAVIISETNPDQAMELFQGIAGDPAGDKTSVNMADEGADNKDEADLLAKIRLEELSTYKVVFTGTTGIPCITPGFILTISTPSGDEHEVLITHVSHSGNNLDDPALAAGKTDTPYYECTFTGIPKDTQYRPERQIQVPNVVSTTGRVYSAANDQTLAQRNEVGKYQVTFDFMRGEEDKISNWIRHASHTARSNHFDMPLTPGTEVQIGFIGGNPNRPYILNALENSQSVLHPVTHENPHHAAMITDGMLYTGALKSRQSLHMTADLDPTEVREHISKHPLKHLKKDGTDSGNPVDLIKGDVHIDRTYGERYQWREGVDFNYGLNATYNFGQQYVENHAYQDKANDEVFEVSDKLDAFDNEVASIVRSYIQPDLTKEREVGFIQKDFGNKYHYHEGYAYNWSAGTNGNGIQKTFNFGSSYVENHTANNETSELINNPSSDFPSAPNLNTDLITKTTGNTFDWQKGNKVEVHTGDFTSEMKGEIKETITGNTTSSNTGNIDETINGDITTTHIGNITETLTGDQTVTLMGNIMETHNQGDVTLSRVGATSETYMGTKTSATFSAEAHTALALVANNYNGGYANITTLVALDTFAGGKIETHHGPKVINQVNEIIVTKADIKKGMSAISKYTSNIINSAITMIG